MKLRFGLLASMCLACLPAMAAEGPSFDCRTATTARERVVCGNADLARADRDMAAAYGAARRRLDPTMREALVADQKGFVEGLDNGFDAEVWFKATIPESAAQVSADIRRVLREGGSRIDGLAAEMTTRAAMLRGLVLDRPGFDGVWMNHEATIEVAPGDGGKRRIVYGAGSYGWPKYACHFRAEGRIEGDGLVGVNSYNTDIDEARGSRLDLRREGALLRLAETVPEGDFHYACVHSPNVEGLFFRVDPKGLPKRRAE